MAKIVLIVEDDKLQMKLVTDLLRVAGYETVQSSDGINTLHLAKTHKPDLIIMDIRLPNVSGLERTKNLKADADLKYIPVVAMTGYPLSGGIQSVEDAGCVAYLSKPISALSLYDTVEKYIA